MPDPTTTTSYSSSALLALFDTWRELNLRRSRLLLLLLLLLLIEGTTGVNPSDGLWPISAKAR